MTEPSEYMKRVYVDIHDTERRVSRAIAEGMSPTDAINKHAHTAESYSAMLKQHGLSPDIPD